MFQLGIIAHSLDTIHSFVQVKCERRKALDKEEEASQRMIWSLVAYIERAAGLKLSDSSAACIFALTNPHEAVAEAMAQAVAA